MSSSTRILIVDDHAQVREDLRMVFQLAGGIDVVGEAGDGQEAISKAQALHPDVILMDLKMPGMDSLEAIRAIKAEDLGKVVVLTLYGFPALREAARKAGCDGYLIKGADISTIVNTISQVLSTNSNLSNFEGDRNERKNK